MTPRFFSVGPSRRKSGNPAGGQPWRRLVFSSRLNHHELLPARHRSQLLQHIAKLEDKTRVVIAAINVPPLIDRIVGLTKVVYRYCLATTWNERSRVPPHPCPSRAPSSQSASSLRRQGRTTSWDLSLYMVCQKQKRIRELVAGHGGVGYHCDGNQGTMVYLAITLRVQCHWQKEAGASYEGRENINVFDGCRAAEMTYVQVVIWKSGDWFRRSMKQKELPRQDAEVI
ncbi:hypothetical protein B0T21DRAFT_397423 [Apiosordaria backusii]|uniref:Uncharacterized protein n=1 Tax=Apiosordaria backusii TaxID=314023 RepID=A0AA39ZRQ7_9PEZI|nr:hypothetical protein B0T21DRAFT_397423 [Apiosordaria backusii]